MRKRLTNSLGLKIALASTLFASALAASADPATVLYQGRSVEIQRTLSDPNDLWVTPEDLTAVSGFVLKEEGACLDSICVPVNRGSDSSMYVERDGQAWFNVTQLARNLNQAYVADHEKGVWSFGEIPATRHAYRQSAVAPDFELADRQGNPVKLSDFRGKKVMIVTWASW